MIQFRVEDGNIVQVGTDNVFFKGDDLEGIVDYLNTQIEALEEYTTWSGITNCEKRLAYINHRLFNDLMKDADKKYWKHRKNGDEEKAKFQRIRFVAFMECEHAFYDMSIDDI